MSSLDDDLLLRRLVDAIQGREPVGVIRRMVADNAAVLLLTKRNDGFLPLHLAALFGASLEVVQFLADKCPDALLNKNVNVSL